MMQQLQQNYSTQFANQSAILSSLNSTFGNILAAGPSQFGFSPQMTSALRTQSDTGTANAYQSAKQAVGEQAASIGGGNMALPSGTLTGINANLAQQAASQQSNQQLGITEAGYAQGLQNFNNAAGVLGGVAQQYSPLGYANATTGAGQAAFGGANTINQQNLAGQQQMWGLIGGAGGALMNGLLPGAGSILGGGGGSSGGAGGGSAGGAGDLSAFGL
jgi:hypothetical protein